MLYSRSNQRTCCVPGLLPLGRRGPKPHYSAVPHSWNASSLTSLLIPSVRGRAACTGSKPKTWWGPSIIVRRCFSFEGQVGEEVNSRYPWPSARKNLESSQLIPQCIFHKERTGWQIKYKGSQTNLGLLDRKAYSEGLEKLMQTGG